MCDLGVVTIFDEMFRKVSSYILFFVFVIRTVSMLVSVYVIYICSLVAQCQDEKCLSFSMLMRRIEPCRFFFRQIRHSYERFSVVLFFSLVIFLFMASTVFTVVYETVSFTNNLNCTGTLNSENQT